MFKSIWTLIFNALQESCLNLQKPLGYSDTDIHYNSVITSSSEDEDQNKAPTPLTHPFIANYIPK